VRKAINLVTSVKHPFPRVCRENRARRSASGSNVKGHDGCIRLEDRRWCYDQLHPGNRAEMLRIRNEPSRGVYVGALYYYVVDYDSRRVD